MGYFTGSYELAKGGEGRGGGERGGEDGGEKASVLHRPLTETVVSPKPSEK